MKPKASAALAAIIFLLIGLLSFKSLNKPVTGKQNCCLKNRPACSEKKSQPADNMLIEPISRQFISIPAGL